jgi:hypothetical protein
VFVQIIEGTTSDQAGLRRQFERWVSEVRPGATGFLGSTAGVTDDGRLVCVARFESEAAARANSDRPEQGEWWTGTEKLLDGPASFTESSDVETWLAGGSDDAGFVQVMKGSGVDRSRVRAMDQAFERIAADARPDLIGGLRVWTGEGDYVEVAYFTSEAEARAGEATEPPEELRATFDEYQDLMQGVTYLDLREPLLASG